MKILLVHNYYGSVAPSGENRVFDAEVELLRERGHEVEQFSRHSDEIRAIGIRGIVAGALSTPWNFFAAKALRLRVETSRPDIVHAHNTFPLLSPAIFHAIGSRAARVLTLHNYRLFCAAGIPMRNGSVCTQCLDTRSVFPALRHGCYRASRAATVPMAASISLHRSLGTWRRQVDAFVALSEFQQRRMVDAGLPRGRVHVKPNFYPGSPKIIPWTDRADRAVFVGRISEEKGVSDLVTAWLRWGESAPELVIVGDGPLRLGLENRVANSGGKRIRFIGQVSTEKAQHWIASSKLLVLPSKCFEGFPMALSEAFAFGTPSVVSDLGPLPDLVCNGEAGAISRAGDPADLSEVLTGLWRGHSQLMTMARRARQEFESKYTEDANYNMMMAIYERAIETSRLSLAN